MSWLQRIFKAPDTSPHRANWMSELLFLGFAFCVFQLIVIQVFQSSTLASEGERVRTAVSEIGAKRGEILDVNGVVLADSVQAYHIAVNQKAITTYEHKDDNGNVVGRGPAEAAKQLSPLLGISQAELGGMMLGDSTYVYLKKNVDAVTYREIRKLDITGIEWEAVFDRTYPNGNTAGPIVGAVNAEGDGVSGLEAYFNNFLQGTSGEEAYEISPNGAVMPGGKKVTKEPQDGGSVRTTLHADLQHLVQDALDARVRKHNADWGVVVISDVSTGRILVLADSGSTTPNPSKPQSVMGVQAPYEPGSVGKLLTVTSALEKGTTTPTSAYSVPYSISPADAGGPISDYHEHGTEMMTTTGILTQSSNVGTIEVGEQVGDRDRYDFMTKMGLNQVTGIELAGESQGIMRDFDAIQGRDRYTMMFGQSYAITAIQQNQFIQAIGNRGVMIAPRIIDSTTDSKGRTEKTVSPQPKQVMSADRSKELITMMESVVMDKQGTGQLAKVEGYRVAVKTGTAEIKVNGADAVVSNTAGLVPAESPRLAISVVLYNPRVAGLSSDAAAPLWSEVTTEAVRNLGIPASTESAQLYPTTP